MLALSSALVTLANLLLSLVVGIRLFRLARRGSGFGPEFWLASFFLLAAFLGAGLNISVYAGLADPKLALSSSHGALVLAASTLTYCLGTLGLYVFIWLTFRRESAGARVAVVAGSVLTFGAACAQGLTEGFAVKVFPGVAYWVFYVARVTPYYWLSVEALRYWSAARRRVRIGLADPLVTNRFLLLGLWSVAWAAMGSPTSSRAASTGPSLALPPRSTSTRQARSSSRRSRSRRRSTGSAAVTLALSFFPTRAYRRFVEARAAASRI